jgi:ABC-type amino acid transport substrate-binding protein
MRQAAILAVALALVCGSALAAEPSLQKIKSSGEIVIGHREEARPFSFAEAGKSPTGYTVDLCLRIVEAVKAELGMANLAVRYVPVTAENRFAKVADGSIDLECGNSTITLSRMQTVDFTNMIFITGASMLVRAGEQIEAVNDLGGKSVAVGEGTTTKKELEAKLKAGLIQATVVPVKDHADGLKALQEKRVDAYAGDQIVLIGLARNAEEPGKLALVRELFSYEPYGIALRRNDADFRLVANRALAQLYRGGEITGVYDRWFGDWGGQPSRLLVAMFALNGIPE